MPNSGPRARAVAVERARLIERGGIDRDHRVEARIELLDPVDRGAGALFGGGMGVPRLLREGGGGAQRERRGEEQVSDHGRSKRCRRSTARPRLALRFACLRPLDRLDDQPLGHGAVAPAVELRPFAGLEVLIMGEEMLDLLGDDRRQIGACPSTSL